MLARRLCDVVVREGVREYYEARTGAGMGAKQFGWSTLAWELAEPVPEAAPAATSRPSGEQPQPRSTPRGPGRSAPGHA